MSTGDGAHARLDNPIMPRFEGSLPLSDAAGPATMAAATTDTLSAPSEPASAPRAGRRPAGGAGLKAGAGSGGGAWRSTALKVGAALLVLGALAVLLLYFGRRAAQRAMKNLSSFVDEHETAGVFVYVGFYLPWIVCCLPSTPCEVLAGFLFGVGRGTAVNACGACGAASPPLASCADTWAECTPVSQCPPPPLPPPRPPRCDVAATAHGERGQAPMSPVLTSLGACRKGDRLERLVRDRALHARGTHGAPSGDELAAEACEEAACRAPLACCLPRAPRQHPDR